MQIGLQKLTSSFYFELFISFVIMLNSAILGSEHYEQPEWVDTMQSKSNYVFALIYIIEMALKLLGLGCLGYCSDGFNVFDGTIVIISMLEFVLEEGSSGLVILRGFRLLRVLKLIKRFKGLKTLI
jgi:hypothetical protein